MTLHDSCAARARGLFCGSQPQDERATAEHLQTNTECLALDETTCLQSVHLVSMRGAGWAWWRLAPTSSCSRSSSSSPGRISTTKTGNWGRCHLVDLITEGWVDKSAVVDQWNEQASNDVAAIEADWNQRHLPRRIIHQHTSQISTVISVELWICLHWLLKSSPTSLV